MIISKMHWLFKDRFNRLDSNHYEDLTPARIDNRLQNAINFFVEHYAQSNQLPFESTQSRLDMISTLVVRSEPVQPTLISDNLYEVRLDNLSYEYKHLVRASIKCSDQDAGIVSVRIIKHDDLTHSLNDEFQKPNIAWKRVLGTIGKNTNNDNTSSLFIYTDGLIDTVYIDYIRKPVEVFFGGYNTLEYLDCQNSGGVDCSQYNSNGDDPVHCDIAEGYHDLIVDFAVREAWRNIQSYNDVQILDNKIQSQTN